MKSFKSNTAFYLIWELSILHTSFHKNIQKQKLLDQMHSLSSLFITQHYLQNNTTGNKRKIGQGFWF